MQNTASFLNDVHAKLAPSDDTLSAAHSRRNEVLKEAQDFNGVLRAYKSGSIAHQTGQNQEPSLSGLNSYGNVRYSWAVDL